MPGRETPLKVKLVDELFKAGFIDNTASAIRAGYSAKTAAQSVSRALATDKWVIAEIQRRKELADVGKTEEEVIDADRVVKQLGTVAFGTVLDLGGFKDGNFELDEKKLTPETAAMIREIRVTTDKDGKQQIDLKLSDRMPALNTLSRILGLMTGDVHLHKHTHTHFADMTDGELIDHISNKLEGSPGLLETLKGSTEKSKPRTVN